MASPNTAFLFPGQGSQAVGMLALLAETSAEVARTFAVASEVLGYDLWALCQHGPEERLNRTEVTQPAMLAAGIATWRAWKERGGRAPMLFAGHSLGEYSALVAAECMQFADAVRMVAVRGRLMQAAVPEGAGAMAAVLGLDDEVLVKVCAEAAQGEVVSCANFNAPGQVVIAGQRAAVDRAGALAREAGAHRVVMLPVSVPSHCALMRPAADALRAELQSIPLNAPRTPVVQNADVRAFSDPESIIDALVRQLWQPVRWTETISYMVGQRVGHFIECGPGKVLAGLNRRISRDSGVTALLDLASFELAQERGAA
jgi:[acyl-carrier-protein] S-malonyltransferase